MLANPQHPYRMVIAVDLSEYANVVLEHAFDLAARHEACEIHVLLVHEAKASLGDEKSALLQLVRENLETFQPSEPTWQVRLHVRDGDIPERIAEMAAEAHADIIVMGRFGVHRTRHGLGPTEQLLAQAPCPTLVVQLVDQVIEANPQCADCVDVRRASEGERWFCDAHVASERDSLYLPPSAPTFTGGGLMW